MLNEPTETKEEKRMRKTGGILTIIGGGLFGIRIGISVIEAFVTGADIFWMYKDVALVIAFAIVALIIGITIPKMYKKTQII